VWNINPLQFLARRQVPEAHRVVVGTAGNEALAVRREADARTALGGVSGQLAHLLAGFEIPETNYLIAARRREFGLGTVGDAAHRGDGARKGAGLLARVQVPQTHGRIVASGKHLA